VQIASPEAAVRCSAVRWLWTVDVAAEGSGVWRRLKSLNSRMRSKVTRLVVSVKVAVSVEVCDGGGDGGGGHTWWGWGGDGAKGLIAPDWRETQCRIDPCRNGERRPASSQRRNTQARTSWATLTPCGNS
jgi:hypothetical protein